MRFVEHLISLYAPVGNEWVNKNGIVFLSAKHEGLSIAGSIAVAIGRKKAIRIPGDIDFVCSTNEEARRFIARLEAELLKHKVYWRVMVNNRTDFCPDGCTTHYRILCPFWLPICVMVIGEVRSWRISGGNQVQQLNDVVKAAESLDERDGRSRMEEDEPQHEPIGRKLLELDIDFADSIQSTEEGIPYP